MKENNDCALGNVVSILTTQMQEIKGRVFAHDANNNLLIIQSEFNSELFLDFVNTSHIKELELLEIGNPRQLLKTRPLSIQKIRDREKKQTEALQSSYRSKIGKDATREAQMLFNEISQTLLCSWDGPDILVSSEVRISPPYGTENCTAILDESARSVPHVKKICWEKSKRSRIKTFTVSHPCKFDLDFLLTKNCMPLQITAVQAKIALTGSNAQYLNK